MSVPMPLRIARRRVRRGGFVALALLPALLFGACQPNPATSPLVPTGGDTPGGECTSQFTRIQMVGDFTNPPFNLGVSPDLVQIEDCVWRVTVTLPAGQVLFKFVTEDAFDNPPDYGGDETVTLQVPGGPHPTSLVQGTGTAIKLNVAAAGDYTFTLDEGRGTFTAIEGAPPATGAITGTVAFAGVTSPPFPQATVEVFSGATRLAVRQSDPTTRVFRFDGLDPGTYRVAARANCFGTAEVAGIAVGVSEVNVGELSLAGGGSTFTSIRMVGSFTTPEFSIPISPAMTQVGGCIWQVDVMLPAGQVLFKFVTNDNFDSPQDYGGDENATLAVPGGPHPTMPVSGSGTAIKINVATAGTYTVTLNEAARTWRADPSGAVPTGGITGTVSFPAIASAPFPAMSVELDSAGTVKARVNSSRTDRTFAFAAVRAGTYTVRARASGYAPNEVTGINVGTTVVSAGDLPMADGPSQFLNVDVVGGFNIFTPGADPMAQGPTATWTRERALPAGQWQFKFLTDLSFNDPPDYGANDATVTVVPGQGTAWPVTATQGQSITIQVDNPGTFRFILDERRQAWEIQQVPPRRAGDLR